MAEVHPVELVRDVRHAPERFVNRELSWIDFGWRILELAADEREPPLERAKFLAVLSQGMDEFFQVRVAGLKDQLLATHPIRSPDGLDARSQLRAIREHLVPLWTRIGEVWREGVLPALGELGIELVAVEDLSPQLQRRLHERFLEELFPILTPLSVDPAHPFPYISNLSLNLAVRVRDRAGGELRFARVKVPSNVPRLFPLGDLRYCLLEDVIASFVGRLFPGMTIEEVGTFRVTRNTDLVLEEGEADDLLELVETELRRRRFGRAVRLEVDARLGEELVGVLVDELELHPDDVWPSEAPIDGSFCWELVGLPIDEGRAPAAVGATPPAFRLGEEGPSEIFARMAHREILVHHPYESFATTVEAFVRAAAADPDVLAIKQTLYRTSGDSAIVEALVEAAEAGKQVVVIIEVKARFDELANIAWARHLEEAGVHVVYGVVGLKTHLKAAMAVRREGHRLVRYCHVATGNYNAKTARTYEDIGLFSADPVLGNDLAEVFNYLTGFSRPEGLQRVVLAPAHLRAWLLEQIEAQAARGPRGRIRFKVNALVDPEIIDALYDASERGVEIDGIVRGLCSLRAGVPGLSATIRIRSIVGSFLEHSRIYVFGEGEGATVAIASADLMQRNLDRRVELLIPLGEEESRERILRIVELALSDDTYAWELEADGSWRRRLERRISLQRTLNAEAGA